MICVNCGVVFWLDSTDQHGLVAAFSDVANYTVESGFDWHCYGTNLPDEPKVAYNGSIPKVME